MSALAAMLRESAARHPDGTAVRFHDEALTYAELDGLSDHVAGALAATGLAPGERVAMFMPNCIETVVTYFGCFKAGLVAVPLNHRYIAHDAEYALRQSGSRALIAHPELVDRIRDLPYADIGVEHRHLVDATPDDSGWEPFSALQGADGIPTDRDGTDAVIIYTSGTTGNPKGAVWTQDALYALATLMAELFAFEPDTVQLLPTPITHIGGLSHCLTAIRAAATNVVVESAEPPIVLAAIERYGAHGMLLLPTGLDELVEADEHHRHDLSSLRWVAAGGDKVPLELHRRFREILGWQVTEGIGMTECSHYASNPPFGEKRIGSVGVPTEGREVRIVDHDGADVAVGKTGEIVIRSHARMDRYWDNPEATAAAVRDGWLHTGDLGRIDDDGFLWFQGRSKELIIRAGSNITPQEVEEVIYQHPAVHLACVVGAPDPHLGARVEAYVSLVADADPKPMPEELEAFIADRIAAYKVPERIFILDRLPRNPTGKVDRHKLETEIIADLRAAGTP